MVETEHYHFNEPSLPVAYGFLPPTANLMGNCFPLQVAFLGSEIRSDTPPHCQGQSHKAP